ncbi:centrosomal protein of 295 kDa [Ahaetulla prasina]|uniref:centrosomal protein of 295 kDa n=1 Tax=Ahaetulla prasina TaxID=499056 RepID=UPI0026486247|nr:centrosomal protein of 295 kDa [Ahaetulla prasina]
MRRKVAGRLRLSPNEEAQLLKEEHERRRKLRLQQVREQERNIALQIRQDVKQRRDEHLKQLAEELEAEWQKTQDEKIKALENLYLSSLRAVGEGHKEAKENEPDLEALAKQAEERKEAAKKRYKEALKKQKSQKEKSLREQTRMQTGKSNIDLKDIPAVKMNDVDNFSISRHHIFDPHVDREMSTEQPDARLLAKEEAKQKEELQNDKERERREQLEKAYLRGKHALKMVRLARDKEKLMKELEQMQNVDLAHRRRIVSQMPPQLFEPSYRRAEIKEEWQRELEGAFEDMYTGNMKMKGDLILHLDPQPLPALSEASQDDELELSQEPEPVCELSPKLANEIENNEPSDSKVEKTSQPPAKLALKKLLNKIRNQKDNWTSRCESEVQSDIGTIESGTISNGGEKADGLATVPEPESKQDPAAKPSEELPEVLDHTIVAENELIKQAQEQTTKIRKELERFTQTAEQQLQQTTERKIQLEIDFLKAIVQHQEQEAKTEQEKKEQERQTEQNVFDSVVHQKQDAEYKTDIALEPQGSFFPKEDDHLKRIHDCQQRLLVQNRMHQESVDEARRKLEEYQNKLQQRFQSVSRALLNPVDRLAHLNSFPDPLSQAQELHQPEAIKATAYKPPEKVSVPEPIPSWQKNKDQGQAQPTVDSEKQMQVNQRCFHLAPGSPSHQEKDEPDVLGTTVAHSLEFHKMSGSLLPKPEATSATTQPVARIPNVQFVLPAGDARGPSETLLSEALPPDTPPAEKILLPTFLKHQDIPGENRINTVSNQSRHLPLHSTSSSPPPITAQIKGIQESPSASKKGHEVLSSCSDIVELRDHLLASSESIEVQQEHLKDLQERLDEQRETLLFRQKIQEDMLLQRHAQLKQKMEQQQEALKDIIKRVTQLRPCSDMTEAKPDSLNLLSVLLNEAEDGNPKQVHFDDTNNHAENDSLFQEVNSVEQTGQFQSMWSREEKQRLSKPPLVKIKPGLDLKQHELSAIQELDTPRSDRFSATEISGYKEHLTGDMFLTPQTDKLWPGKSPIESLQEEIDLLRTISMADDKELDFGQSPRSMQGSCHDELTWKANGLYDSVYSKECTSIDRNFSNYSTDNGRRVTSPDPSLRPNSQVILSNAWSPSLLTPTTCTQQVAPGYFSSVTPSAANFIKNYNADNTLAGKESCAAKEQINLFSFPAKESSSVASFLQKSDDSSKHPSSRFSFEEMEYDGSKIQQIINKYRKDFSWSSLSNVSSGHDPAVGLDAIDIERNFPNFHRELFQPLKPSSDFDLCSTLSQCRISHSSKDLSKVSDLSKSQYLTSSTIEEGRNNTLFLSMGNLSNSQLKGQSDERMNQPRQAVQLVAEELTEPLSLGSTLHNNFGRSEAFSFNSEGNLELNKDYVEDPVVISSEIGSCEDLRDDSDFRYFCSSVENFRSLTPVEDQISMYEMIPSFSPRKSTHERTESAKEDTSSTTESLCFVELAAMSFNKKNETETRNRLVETDVAQCDLNSTRGQSFPTSKVLLGCLQEMNSGGPFQNSAEENISQPAMFPQLNRDAIQAKSLDSRLSQCSSIPVWETLTGRGIMEEPDLTLVSSNDISTAESELIPSDHFEVKDCPQSRGFFPLNPEVDEFLTQLDYPPITPSLPNYPDQNSKPRVILSELAPVHGSLQESFLKQKKDFIERSLKRVEKVKNRHRSPEKTQSKELPLKKAQLHKRKGNQAPLGAAVNLLKKGEGKKCSPLNRKAGAAQRQQRTSRLYNNLAEVKNRKEEKDRKEIYAKNRERAKEFQKRTLEKLRARKINLKT